MKKSCFLFTLLFVSFILHAVGDVYRYRVFLRDKNGLNIHLSDPAISQDARNRRSRQSIPVDSTDFPVSLTYLATLRANGFPTVTQSRWLNTVVVSMGDTSRLSVLRNLPFVKSVQLVWINPQFVSAAPGLMHQSKDKFRADSVSPYGQTQTQVEMLGLRPLHEKGYKGKGITIAVIDAGFLGADTVSYFKNVSIKAVRDFVQPATTVYNGHYHGTAVLSQMAVNAPGVFVGTAPEATYCLLRSEENASEFPIEEDYWAAAAEFADSIGADVINSSLGYYAFDYSPLNYTLSQLDGKTGFVTKAASFAASKGMLVVISAGNEGALSWKKICFPADAPDVVTVGAINSSRTLAYFSSRGPTADGRIKPDVVATGRDNLIVMDNGSIAYGSGTSYASPLIAGMAACIWSGMPQISAKELKERIIRNSDQFSTPDTLFGYGIPNAYAAWSSSLNSLQMEAAVRFSVYPSLTTSALNIRTSLKTSEQNRVYIYNMQGICVWSTRLISDDTRVDLSALPSSVYMVEWRENGIRKATTKIQIRR